MTCPRITLTTLLFFGFIFVLCSQSASFYHRTCGTDLLREAWRKERIEHVFEEQKVELAWSRQAKMSTVHKADASPYSIPIVFHLVHENGPENLTDAAIERTLGYVNQAFANTGVYDRGRGVNTQIQFCFAQRTPDNQPTNGIDRIVSPLTTVNAPSEDLDLKDLRRWNPTQYLNVWVVKTICGLGSDNCLVSGYAYYPTTHGSRRDGIVIEAQWLADNPGKVGVLVHEIGHYLGLRHTFEGGCKNDDCMVDGDAVCDTPPDQSKAALPCDGTTNSCSTDTDSGFTTDQNDQFHNYMDYGNLDCYSAFTAGQRERMHFFLEGRRRSLLESRGCLPTCSDLIVASFENDNLIVSPGTTVDFLNNSVNGSSYIWRVNNRIFSTSRDASREFLEEGRYEIHLTVSDDSNLCASEHFSQYIEVVCPLTASFRFDPTIYAGQEVVFENHSTGGEEYRWTVDGLEFSTTQNSTYAFSEPGQYTICLETTAGLCRNQACRTASVRELPCTTPDCADEIPDDCIAGFYRRFIVGEGNAFTDISFTSILPLDTNYIIGGNGTIPPIVKVTERGRSGPALQLLREGEQGTIIEMKRDRAGMVYGIGQGQNAGNTEVIVFRLNPATMSLLWGKRIQVGDKPSAPASIQQMAASDDYIILGTYGDSLKSDSG
ncbi:MAG: M43 family zinc metalloprotease, partial [Bacteroidota bacterium]